MRFFLSMMLLLASSTLHIAADDANSGGSSGGADGGGGGGGGVDGDGATPEMIKQMMDRLEQVTHQHTTEAMPTHPAINNIQNIQIISW